MNSSKTFKGSLTADFGTFPSCVGCNFTGTVNFKTYGIGSSIVMASVVLTAMFAVVFAFFRVVAGFKVEKIHFVTKKGRAEEATDAGIRSVLSRAALTTALYAASIATREAANGLKGAYVIIYVAYAFLQLYLELYITFTLDRVLVARFSIFRGKERLESKKPKEDILISILNNVSPLIILGILARLLMVIVETALLFGGWRGINQQRLLTIFAGVATGAKVLYLVISFILIALAIQLLDVHSQCGADNSIPRSILFTCVSYFVWALCAVAVQIAYAYTHTLSESGRDLVAVFTYDLPLAFCFLGLLVAGTRPYWHFVEWDASTYGPPELFSGISSRNSHGPPEISGTQYVSVDSEYTNNNDKPFIGTGTYEQGPYNEQQPYDERVIRAAHAANSAHLEGSAEYERQRSLMDNALRSFRPSLY